MPPTPFFQYTVDEDFDWDDADYEFDVFDSVLDECMSIGLPVKMLRWHYRSKHDSLIDFSNQRFYDGRLLLFPAARHWDKALETGRQIMRNFPNSKMAEEIRERWDILKQRVEQQST